MIDGVITFLVVVLLALVTVGVATRFSPAMRPWVWFAFGEYMLCAAGQLVYSRVVVQGGDTLFYAQTGAEFAKMLDANFGFASRELLSMLFQKESAFDGLIDSPMSNTSSMHAAAAWLVFFLRGSETAAHVLVAGLSMFGALSIYRASQDACPEAPPLRLFVATVLFPSIAFWTSALHKEAFGLMGIGALLAAWRAIYKRQIFRAIIYAPLGLALILLFRAPAIPPIALGLVVFFAWDRLQKSRGAETFLLGPIYIAGGLAVLAVAMVAVSRVSPALALDQLGETVALKQQAWTQGKGGSGFDGGEDVLQQTLAAQLIRFPLALVNALFRPQFFDVHNFVALLSAVEMTVITFMIIRALRLHGIGGIFVRIQRSPFLLMCAVITLVGCTFVGLVTLNYGSLARYRVPFLPFYGALVTLLSQRTATVPASEPAKKKGVRPSPRGRGMPPARAPRTQRT